ncbi:hypothetical protein BCT46_13695 [Vibrio sp. 10N.261.46.E8]|nr:hypothetical protein BH584_05675 [Vibrio sp. 10N.261.45.E1]PMJ26893.1 hypothetical protein BCU27_08815 [Vibrio sp. 10N.286.45.B6]PML94184.1 hypothetical protein BCT66_24100 [Vibrio sp. 10N.261.49.E11]PMM82886.1 hypothetical protein BCT46_13695 [Vibrio sp. 10N.261.46.E8]PMN93974.1 hypothetical protein BCT22_23490 [Vibrio sp. 10N.261.45.A1]
MVNIRCANAAYFTTLLEAGHEHLPLVIPLQFYHGKVSPYPYAMNWLKGFANPDQAKALYTQDVVVK